MREETHGWVNLNGRRYCSFSASRNAKNPSRPAPLARPTVTVLHGYGTKLQRTQLVRILYLVL